jgi:phosphatidylglycerophosphatase A
MPPEPAPPKLIDTLVLWLAEGCWLGRIPKAPGTFGSLWGLPIGWLFWHFQTPPAFRGLIWLALFLPGIWLCSHAARLRQRKDPGSVVWDEITAFPLVWIATDFSWPVLITGFLLFRLFDIAKPWPVRQFEKLPGGLGIMADDQIAAVYAAIGLLLIF